jgi:hypothetical protein
MQYAKFINSEEIFSKVNIVMIGLQLTHLKVSTTYNSGQKLKFQMITLQI